MKKHLSYLLAVLCFMTVAQANAADVLPGGANINIPGQYNPGAYNATEVQNMSNYAIDKGYVQTLDDVNKDEQIYDATVEENMAREGVLYNPHFMLEKRT